MVWSRWGSGRISKTLNLLLSVFTRIIPLSWYLVFYYLRYPVPVFRFHFVFLSPRDVIVAFSCHWVFLLSCFILITFPCYCISLILSRVKVVHHWSMQSCRPSAFNPRLYEAQPDLISGDSGELRKFGIQIPLFLILECKFESSM